MHLPFSTVRIIYYAANRNKQIDTTQADAGSGPCSLDILVTSAGINRDLVASVQGTGGKWCSRALVIARECSPSLRALPQTLCLDQAAMASRRRRVNHSCPRSVRLRRGRSGR
jgi:hypothetical protein